MSDQERTLLLAAFDSNWIAPLGPQVDGFERDLAKRVGVHDAAALNSGTAALHLALILLEVGAGDEVWTSTLTFAATANAIRYVGATPVFIDSERESWNMDPALLHEALREASTRGALPKALIVVDLYGQCANYDAILEACREYGVPVVEDAAEALGATYRGKAAGSFGTIGVLSFNGNKIITTSGGGALVSDDADLVARARHLASQAKQPVAHYEHEEVGYNYRLSNLLAAVGRGQLARLDGFVERRREINRTYRAALEGIDGVSFLPEAPGGHSTCWLTCVLLDELHLGVGPAQVREHLETHNIEARPVWKPMHLQPVYQDRRVVGGAVAEDLFRRGLCLPSGSVLSHEDQQRVIDAFLQTPQLRSAEE
ncbi:MAG: aminotransferase class I/II-fold pyridoxal phosphate-dependent enzyme [Deltaproteobacteria bacterium]|nr:aminotransferase class I/II-fold pyridoxal phosphate-dependent enzyme [Deltaproteobacteria bacterium]MBW2629151.1 aminotransferase class I/II-fold pyridoxal phosphate-dependent enzyme [Deltaproteobacteria bacterium]